MSNIKTVLLTGANGLLGQKLVEQLADRNSVRLIATSLGRNRNTDRMGYTYQSLDVTNFDQLQAAFATHRPTEVIHSAAMTNVDACEQDPDACRALNVDAVRNIAGLCKEYGTRLIHLSTDFIFDGKAGPYKETDAPNPLSVYGRSKAEAEDIIHASGIPAAIARTVLIYGVAREYSRTNIVLWVRKSLLAGQSIRVVNDQWRSPTLAEDLAEGVCSLLFRDKTGVYHLSGGEIYSILDIAYKVADYFGANRKLITPVSSAELNQPAARPPRTGFVILKAQTELDYQPHSLVAGLDLVNRQVLEAEDA